MADEDEHAQDAVEQGVGGVQVDVLLVLCQGAQHVGGEDHRQDEDDGGAHHLGRGALRLVDVLQLGNSKFGFHV